MHWALQLVLGLLFVFGLEGFRLGTGNAPVGGTRKFLSLSMRGAALVAPTRDGATGRLTVLEHVARRLAEPVPADCEASGRFSARDIALLRQSTAPPFVRQLLQGIAPESVLSPGPEGSLWVEAAAVDDEARGEHEHTTPVVVHVHGGYVAGGPAALTDATLAYRLAVRTRYRVLLVSYPLAPDATAVQQGAAVAQVIRTLFDANVDRPIALTSSGAGAVVALQALLTLKRTKHQAMVARVALLSPLVSEGAELPANVEDALLPASLRRCLADAYRTASNGTLTAGDLQHMPPMLLQAGEEEAAHHDAQLLASLVQSGGGTAVLDTMPRAVHVMAAYSDMCFEGAEALRRVAEFVKPPLQEQK